MNNDYSVYPSREICSVIYKKIKSNGGWNYSFDDLYFTLNGVTYGQLKYALTAFEECGLISFSGEKISIENVQSKVDLMNSPVIKLLKGRLNIG